MAFPPNDDCSAPGAAIPRRFESSAPAWSLPLTAAQVDAEQAFRLIDSILPFEACLYHQVFPVALEGSRLRLAMVDPSDRTAMDYVRRILAYMNCSPQPQAIAPDAHHALLSAYLHYKNLHPTTPPIDPRSLQDSRETLIVDSPTLVTDGFVAPRDRPTPESPTDEGTLILAEEPESAAIASPPPMPPPPPAPDLSPKIPPLVLQVSHLAEPVDHLLTLPPQKLLQELLGRVLLGGIGRLYFERHAQVGRILWSQDGVLQSVLEALPQSLFQGLLNELKRLAQISMVSVQKPKQVEIERLYQGQRILLRIRLMPGTHGEEATLQVLRGAALRFHEQQRLDRLSQEALRMAQRLQQTVNEIRQRSKIQDGSLSEVSLEALPAINRVLRHLDRQIQDLSQDAQAEKDLDEHPDLSSADGDKP